MAKSNLKNQLRRYFNDTKNVTKLTSQDFSILGPSNQNFWLRQCHFVTLTTMALT